MGDILGLFDFLMGSDINQGFEEYNQTDGAILLDVREKDEFRAGSALRELKKMGYTNVKNIGGIISFKGKIVK